MCKGSKVDGRKVQLKTVCEKTEYTRYLDHTGREQLTREIRRRRCTS